VKVGRVVLMRVDRQTDKHTDTRIAILRTPTRAEAFTWLIYGLCIAGYSHSRTREHQSVLRGTVRRRDATEGGRTRLLWIHQGRLQRLRWIHRSTQVTHPSRFIAPLKKILANAYIQS